MCIECIRINTDIAALINSWLLGMGSSELVLPVHEGYTSVLVVSILSIIMKRKKEKQKEFGLRFRAEDEQGICVIVCVRV